LPTFPFRERRDGFPQPVIRRKDAVIPVPVSPRRRDEVGEPVEKLERRELDAAARPRPRISGLEVAPVVVHLDTARKLLEPFAAGEAQILGYHAVRAGDNPGEHTILFGLDGESLSLNVRATNRDCYAKGALAAAAFLIGKLVGLYSMRDVLGLA
jgi:hypothetical protein